MVDLVQWLTACLDADAVKAQAAIDAEFITCGQWLARGPYGDGDRYGNIQSELNEQIIEHDLLWPQAVHIVAWDPARVLREIEAKRYFLEVLAASMKPNATTGIPRGVAWSMLTRMAEPYRDRPGWLSYWPGSG